MRKMLLNLHYQINTNINRKINKVMDTKNKLGLDLSTVQSIITGLNDLLANHQVYYTNLRGLHWDIKGDKFFELHELYEEYYNDEASVIDETAERIAMLGGHPENRFSEYLKQAEIKEIHSISDWEAGVNLIISSMQTFLKKNRALLQLAIDANDSGTTTLVRKHITDLESKIWKLTAYMA